MNKILNKFRKRNIQTNIYEFILVIFVVAVSVCLTAGLFINHLTLGKAVDKFYSKSRLPNLWIETDLVTSEDESFLNDKFSFSKRYCFESEFTVGSNSYKSEFLVADGKISVPYIIEGDKGDGCFVDAKFIEKYNIGINHSIIEIPLTFGGETKIVEFKVLGSISMAENLLSENCLIFIDENVFKKIVKAYFSGIDENLININYNQVLITSKISEDDKTILKQHFDVPERAGFKLYDKSNLESFLSAKKEVKNAKIMTYSFSLLFVIVSVLVIASAVGQLVFKEKYNIGLLKSLGVENRELVFNFCGYGTFVCFIGAIIGLAISPLIIPNITFEAYDKIFNLPRDEVKLTCPVWLCLSVILFAVFVGFVSAFFACLNFVKKNPKECMIAKSKSKLKSRKKITGKKKVSFAIISAPFRNMKINLIRTIMSIFGVLGSSVLCIIGFGVGENQSKKALSMQAFSNVFKGFSIVILLLVVIILLVQIFKERSKEMALLRIHGENYFKIWLSILFEMSFICLIGYFGACALAELVFDLFQKIFGINGIKNLNITAYLKTFLLVFAIDFMVASSSLYKVYKLDLPSATKISE